MPLSVASSTLPLRTTYSRLSSVSMIAARVAGVPRPVSFIASESSFSSTARPAVSMAVSSVPSVKRGGGRVRLGTGTTSSTRARWPAARPPGSSPSAGAASSPSAGLTPRGGCLPPPMSSTFQPTCSTDVPELSKLSTAGLPEGSVEATAVTTVVTA